MVGGDGIGPTLPGWRRRRRPKPGTVPFGRCCRCAMAPCAHLCAGLGAPQSGQTAPGVGAVKRTRCSAARTGPIRMADVPGSCWHHRRRPDPGLLASGVFARSDFGEAAEAYRLAQQLQVGRMVAGAARIEDAAAANDAGSTHAWCRRGSIAALRNRALVGSALGTKGGKGAGTCAALGDALGRLRQLDADAGEDRLCGGRGAQHDALAGRQGPPSGQPARTPQNGVAALDRDCDSSAASAVPCPRPPGRCSLDGAAGSERPFEASSAAFRDVGLFSRDWRADPNLLDHDLPVEAAAAPSRGVKFHLRAPARAAAGAGCAGDDARAAGAAPPSAGSAVLNLRRQSSALPIPTSFFAELDRPRP